MPELVSAWDTLGLTALLAYLLGAVPFGVLITRVMGLGDLRKIGSGNIGATNVLRTGNKAAAAATLVLDGAKGAVAVLVARWVVGTEDAAQVAALASFIGHLYPVWLGFRGGKGVATYLGTLIALVWPVGLAACATWLAGALLTRMSSAAALIAAAVTPLWLWTFDHGRMLVLVLILTVLIYVRHAANLGRIKAGTEPKISQKKG
ncbi:glycerol-3-phosphate 1-O-acyltransferase PlsY [Rhodobacter sp. Har01]|uniref:glycerol-3-phosphate 1-O-acyltransferase PlsY n=1 Tax=Rhodobacter sp. Har01 TaxID=2883999 RepID=UPI001D0684D7|nr:glycerol-3-phosphate 1-O-acyltransferase PlsY [Rhodobacter sp. Har01]MCB6179154.1 glycerol-3-phosphate 1-O-acyltransferase PlsY [Rhodobacter sp. Har01]